MISGSSDQVLCWAVAVWHGPFAPCTGDSADTLPHPRSGDSPGAVETLDTDLSEEPQQGVLSECGQESEA